MTIKLCNADELGRYRKQTDTTSVNGLKSPPTGVHTNVINRTICTSEKKKRTCSVIAGDGHYILDLNKERQIINLQLTP